MCPAVFTPKRVFSSTRLLIKISSGLNHALLMDEGEKNHRKVYAWGDCTAGRIGRLPPHRRKIENSLRVETLKTKGLTDIWACGNHSFLKQRGQIYGWGLNQDGQLGLGHTRDVLAPEILKGLANADITQVTGGAFFSVFLDKRGDVWTAGCNVDGQLGLGPTIQCSDTPQHIQFNGAVRLIESGEHFSYALTECGGLFSWGAAANFVLGNKSEYSETTPHEVSAAFFAQKQVVGVSAGSSHVFFQVQDEGQSMRAGSTS